MDPRVWGPDIWHAVHHIALGYPQTPTEDEIKQYRAFFLALGPALPCRSCSVNYERHLLDVPIEPTLAAGGRSLFDWTVRVHNQVNRAKGARELTSEQALTEMAISGHLTGSIMGPQRAVALGTGVIVGALTASLIAWAIISWRPKAGIGRR